MKYGTDYSKSAINLTNPAEVRNLLIDLDVAQKLANIHEEALVATTEYQVLQRAQDELQQLRKKLEAAIDRAGSYQDIVAGLYGLKQKRTSVSYSPKAVRETIPLYADAVITETVDGSKVNGLIKGKLITEAEVAQIEVRHELAPAFIIAIVIPPEGKEETDAD